MLPLKDQFINIHAHKSMPAENEFALLNIFAAEYESDLLIDKYSYSVGLHPWHLKNNNINSALEKVKIASINPAVAFIGETGIDRAIEAPLDLQTEVFLEHLKIAEDTKKPVMLHVVRTSSEVIAIKKKYRFSTPWVVHGFSGSIQSAEQLMKYDCYLSFGKFLFSDTSRIPDIFHSIPSDRIFMESDDTALPIESVYERAAGLRKISVDKLKKIIFNNYLKVVNGAR